MDISIAYEALTKDAATWDGVGDELGEMGRRLGSVHLSRGAFSFGAINTADRYAEVQAQVAALLSSGETVANDTAATLRAVRNAWENHEQSVSSSVSEMWTPDL
jgi:uncharacterized protein with GYD domain